MNKETLEKKLRAFILKCENKKYSFLWLSKLGVENNIKDFLSILEEKDPYIQWATFSFYTWDRTNVGTIYSIHYFKYWYPSKKEMKWLFFTKNVTHIKSPDEITFSKKDDLF